MTAARFVLDNSVVMAWCFEDEANKYADAVLENLEAAVAVVPAVWPLELGNVLLVTERKKRLDKADAVLFLDLVNSLPIVVEQESPQRMLHEIIALAHDHL